MRTGPWRRRLAAVCTCTAAVAALVLVAPGSALANRHDPPGGGSPDWAPCGRAGASCATVTVPKDYQHPQHGTIDLAVSRSPATGPGRRIGSLLINFGGPGGTAADTIEAYGPDLFPKLNERFDLVGFDPRGVGQSRPSIDCRSNQETEGVYAQPFERPETLDVGAMVQRDKRYIRRCLSLNRGILPFVSTANAARDMDRLRAAVGDDKINYLGFSYGTFLGATYESMFPHNVRSIVLDGALDPDQYINDPLGSLDEQTAGFERAIGRFLQACAADQTACLGFGGKDPWAALDALVARANAAPIAAPRNEDPRPVSGDDIDAAVVQAVYSKSYWPLLAQALAEANGGDASLMRSFVDLFYGWLPDGTYDPLTDRYFTLSADEQRYPRDVQTYLKEGRRSYQDYEHAWWNHGYTELAWGLYPIRANSVFAGPWRNPPDAATTLVVGTTYDPATPYKEAQRLTAQLGNARLLTMVGDGHTAYGGNSACIDAAVEAYFDDGTLPAAGTSCPQDEVPFEQPQEEAPAAKVAPSPKVAPSVLARSKTPAQQLAPHAPGVNPWALSR